MMTMADLVGSDGRHHVTGLRKFVPTINMTFDFVAPAKIGDWVEGRCEVVRVTRSLLFTNIYLTVGEEKILRASGIFKIPSGDGQVFDARAARPRRRSGCQEPAGLKSVRRTVRPRRRRSAQPFLKKVSAIAAPSAPEMCGRRSLQSRHWRAKWRVPARLAPSRSTPSRWQNSSPEVGERPVARPLGLEMAVLGQRIGDGHADLAGEMVVAGAAEAEIGIAPPRGGLRDAGWARVAGQRHQQFDGMRHLARGEAVEAVAALGAGGEQVGLGHAGEMARRGLRGDAGGMREVGGGVGAAVHQQLQHGRRAPGRPSGRRLRRGR